MDGAINNPIGTTAIRNTSGSILSGGPGAVVTTNVLDVSAPEGQVGSPAFPLNVDLVQSEDSQHVQRPIQSSVVAGGGAYLNLTGVLRDPDVNPGQVPFTVSAGPIQAGGDIVATLQESVVQTSSGSASFGIEVYEPYKNLTTFVTSHFRPGTGNGPVESIDPGFATGNSTLVNSTYSFTDLTAGGDIKLTGVTASTNVDGVAVAPTIGVTGYTKINPGAANSGVIDTSTNGDVNLTETAGAMRVGVIATTGNVSLFVPDNGPSGNDILMANGSAIVAGGGFIGIGVADNINLAASSFIYAFSTTAGSSSSVFILGDYGRGGAGPGSVISLAGQIFAIAAYIAGGAEDDVISLTNVTSGTVTRFVTGGGVNTVNVGSIPPPAPNGGVTDQIQGPLTVVGDGSDTMNVDDTGASGSQTGTLTDSSLTGLGMAPTGIAYSGLAILNVELGQAPDSFNVNSSAVHTTTTIVTQAVGNTWNVGGLAPTLTGGVLAGGRIAVEGTGGAQSGILGNVIVDRGIYRTGMIGAGSAIVSGGEIGDASYGTSLTVQDGNRGIVAASATVRVTSGSKLDGYVFNDAGGSSNAAAIDAIFTEDRGPLGLDLPNDPLGGLELILQDLVALHVDSNDKLGGPRP